MKSLFSSFLFRVTFWAFLQLLMVSAWSYYTTLTEEGAFQLGLPWVYYYQLQWKPYTPFWNSQLANLAKDFALLWVITAGIALLANRGRLSVG